jgi:secondary thiamine-phosphate synthase enzyme
MVLACGSAELEFDTGGDDQIIDITDQVTEAVDAFGLREGVVTVFIVGSTASVTTMEYEPGLEADVKRWLRGVAPAGDWQHDATWSEANGHSHLRASLIGPSLTVPVEAGRLTLGTWQQIVVIDSDVKPRHRKIVAQMTGEK